MKIMGYREAPVHAYDGGAVKDVRGRVVIGEADGAERFRMRVFELGSGGFTPRHRHDWEHEIFFHAGAGEVFREGNWVPVTAGTVVFVPGGEEHQIRNAGDTPLVFVCLIPAGPPEI